MKNNKKLTVGKLIDKLKNLPFDMQVYTEGCDCHGDASDVKIISVAKIVPDKENPFEKIDVALITRG